MDKILQNQVDLDTGLAWCFVNRFLSFIVSGLFEFLYLLKITLSSIFLAIYLWRLCYLSKFLKNFFSKNSSWFSSYTMLVIALLISPSDLFPWSTLHHFPSLVSMADCEYCHYFKCTILYQFSFFALFSHFTAMYLQIRHWMYKIGKTE